MPFSSYVNLPLVISHPRWSAYLLSSDLYAPLSSQIPQYQSLQILTLQRQWQSILLNEDEESRSYSLRPFCRFFIWLYSFVSRGGTIATPSTGGSSNWVVALVGHTFIRQNEAWQTSCTWTPISMSCYLLIYHWIVRKIDINDSVSRRSTVM